MNIKLHRLTVGSKENTGFGLGATWIIGGAIFLCAFCLTLFSHYFMAKLFLIVNLPLLILFYLTYNFPKLRYLIALIASGIGIYCFWIAIPDFFSSELHHSAASILHLLLGIYYLGVSYFQYNFLKRIS